MLLAFGQIRRNKDNSYHVFFASDPKTGEIDFSRFLVDDDLELVAGEGLWHRVLSEHVLEEG